MKYTVLDEEFEIDGKLYVKGVGKYKDEVNPDSETSDIATVLPNMVNVIYDELVSMRDNSKLVPGQQYRITDYVTVTNQANTEADGRRFDIIVTADDEKTLNENARAIHHEGCDDFKGDNLAAWELKYSLTNENGLYTWGVNGDIIESYGEGDGVYGNVSNTKITVDGDEYYILNVIGCNDILVKVDYEDDLSTYSINEYINSAFEIIEIDDDRLTLFEHGNEYTFTDSVDKTKKYIFPTSTDEYYRLIGDSNCYVKCNYNVGDSVVTYSNQINRIASIDIIKPYTKSKGVIYYMKDEYNNECPYDFKTIRYKYIKGNKGIFVYTFNNRCYGNIIEPHITNSIPKYYLNFITLGYGCCHNTIGKYSKNITLGDYCTNNKIDNECYDIIFGNDCSYNTLGKNCFDITFGKNCTNNKFDNFCQRITFGDYCTYNTFGGYCNYIRFGTAATIKSCYRYITIESGNQYICLNCEKPTDITNYCQNVRIGMGVNNTYNIKTIPVSGVNQKYSTVYGRDQSGADQVTYGI